ncbi:hypothetical protein ASPCAL00071 [Aspergillus calidoustus]|uniref:Zn(2)-C6 fungal-type domain-containing protein n=1 Tax=Aspergillus calidoustus TaxID=454130 RepID=A0A0U5FPE7_ASPCI|nr:hypothetical protein ASPCAL00071 [Aspergillus calidoustus]
MPGVPSGRGCDNCRKSKKKCDEVKPICTRCARRGLECIGAGEKRYKFMEDGPTALARKRSPNRNSKPAAENKPTLLVKTAPSNHTTLLGQALADAILTKDLRYNLLWAYGGYLLAVPSRLGVNEALDTAVDALVTAHRTFSSRKEITVTSLTKYSRALTALRSCLDNPKTASSSETLCAVSLLLHIHGYQDMQWTGHAEGAAKVLKARKSCKPRDNFERILLLSLRGPLFEGIFNPNIQFSAEEWKELVENELDTGTPEGTMLAHLARIPDILDRVRTNTNGYVGLLELQTELKELYTKTRAICNDFATELAAIEANKSTNPSKLPPTILHAHVQRMYGLCIAITLYMNYVLVAIRTVDHSLATDATFLAFEMLNIAEKAAKYRPFGAAYVTIGLLAALMTVNNEALKTLLKASIIDYQHDFRQPHLDRLTMEDKFQWLDPFRTLDVLASYGITDDCLETEQNAMYTALTPKLDYGVDSASDFPPEFTPEFTPSLAPDFAAEFPPVLTPDSTSEILSDTNFELPADLTLELTSEMSIKLRV